MELLLCANDLPILWFFGVIWKFRTLISKKSTVTCLRPSEQGLLISWYTRGLFMVFNSHPNPKSIPYKQKWWFASRISLHSYLTQHCKLSIAVKCHKSRDENTRRGTCIMAFRCSSNCASKLSTFSVFVASFAEGNQSIEMLWIKDLQKTIQGHEANSSCLRGLRSPKFNNKNNSSQLHVEIIALQNNKQTLHPHHPHSLDSLYPLMLWIYLATKSCRSV